MNVSSWIALLFTCFASIMPLATTSIQLSDVNNRICTSLCQCTSKTVDCNHQDRLAFIPSDIRRDYNQLHISHASFIDRHLHPINFSSISHLTSLKIVYSKLESLSDDTFLQMHLLQYMDLSHNHFTTIAPRAFNGLSLINLYLERNHAGLGIAPHMFTGLKVTNLYLRSNGIAEISVTPFENLNLAKLYLFNNSITTINQKFKTLFSSSDHLLDLTKNPLHCSCGLSWFPELINRWQDVPSFVKITCHSPNYLNERLVAKLSTDEFPCETPSINKISVDIADSFVHLVCYSQGNSAPKISWTQVNFDNGDEIPYFEERTTVNRQSYVSINVTKLRRDNSFICKTWNEINSSNQVLVKFKLIENLFQRAQRPTQSFDQTKDDILPRNHNTPTDTHFLFTKQFSILQMIGAVVGTFTSVIVLIFIICCTQEHLLKKNSTSNPYWTIIPSDIKNSSSNTRVAAKTPISPSMAMVTSTSSQDYDIPQYHESNNFLQNYYTERNVPHYVDVKPTNYFSTVT